MRSMAVSVFGWMIILALLITGMYLLIDLIKRYDPVSRIRDKVEELDRIRRLGTEKGRQNILERYLDRLDEHLTQAGIKRFLPKAGVELFFLFNVLEYTFFFCVVGDGILIPLLSAAAAVYINKLIVDLLRFKNRRITENHLLELLNMVSDYAISEGEITKILYRCGHSLPNPLKDVLTKCHLSARSSGNSTLALYELRRSIDHFLFQEIILLLELCSRSDNDYQKVVNGCREMVNRYLKEEKEKAGVIRSLTGEAALMSGVAAYGISMMFREFAQDAGVGMGMADFFFKNPAGQIYLLIYIMLLFAMTKVIFKFAKR